MDKFCISSKAWIDGQVCQGTRKPVAAAQEMGFHKHFRHVNYCELVFGKKTIEDSLNSLKDKPFNFNFMLKGKCHINVFFYSFVNGSIPNSMAFSFVLKGLVVVYVYCWSKKSGVHQLRLVVYPIISKDLYVVVVWNFWTINSIMVVVVVVGRSAFVSGPFKLNVDQEDGQPTAHPR